MKIQDKVEKFLSLASYIQIINEGNNTVMNFLFPKEQFKEYSNMKNHSNVKTYFRDKVMTMIIDGRSTQTTFTLVDTKTGDALNIQNVKFIDFYFYDFIEKVPKDRIISFFLCGQSEDGDTGIMPPPVPDNEVSKIHGYSYIPLPE